MTIIYKFSSLSSLADYFDMHAAEKREAIKDAITKGRAQDLRVAAATLESVAYILRNTKLEDTPE